VLANNSPSALRWENPKTKGARRTVLFLGQSWSFSRHRSERQEWRDSSVRRAEQPERRRFGENSSSIPLTRRCALHVRTKALCGSGKGQPGPSGSEERQCARTARPLFTLVLARTVRQMLWGQCRSEIEGGPGYVKKSLTSPWFSHASWASLKGFIVAHPDRRSCQPPWEDLIVRKVLPSFM